jgi:heme/copper-type cytochrome/quinol oxidase subunit 2
MFSFLESGTFAPTNRVLLLNVTATQGEQLFLRSLLREDRERRRWMNYLIAVCAEVSVLCASIGYGWTAMISCSACLMILAWHYRKETITSEEHDHLHHNRRSLILMLTVFAILVAGWTWYLWPVGSNATHSGTVGLAKASHSLNQGDTSWVGIVLWPNPPRKARITPPPLPHAPFTSVGRMTKPLVIPFSGSYWYFKSSTKGPGPRAHVVHESPIAVIIHSTDWHPLAMEAHQALSAPINVMCCRAIDLAIRNGDNRRGRIDIALKLIDSSTARSETLGLHTVLSSLTSEFRLDRPPVDEVLRYRIPTNTLMRQFDQIEIIFEPSPERSLGGEQIEIREFRLLPEY